MDLTLKDIPEQCIERIKQVARNIVEGYKISQLRMPKADMNSFDTANGMLKKEKEGVEKFSSL